MLGKHILNDFPLKHKRIAQQLIKLAQSFDAGCMRIEKQIDTIIKSLQDKTEGN